MSRSKAETEAAKELKEYFGSREDVLSRQSFPVRYELSKHLAQRLASGEDSIDLAIVEAQNRNLYAHSAIMQLAENGEWLTRLPERHRDLIQTVARRPAPKRRSGKSVDSYWERNSCIRSGIQMLMERGFQLDRADGTASHSAISLVDEALREIGIKGMTEIAIRQIWYRSAREQCDNSIVF